MNFIEIDILFSKIITRAKSAYASVIMEIKKQKINSRLNTLTLQ